MSEYKPPLVRSAIMFLWAVFSTVVYGTIVVVTVFPLPWFARFVAKRWMMHIGSVAGLKLDIQGLEHLDKDGRYIFVANHQSALDIPAVHLALPYHLSFIAKKELFFIPFLGWGMALMGHIWIDRSSASRAMRSIRRAVKKLAKGNCSLVIFAEGTRSYDGKIARFKKGGFALALESKVPIVPVAISGTRILLPKKKMRVMPGTAQVHIAKPIAYQEIEGMDRLAIAELVRSKVVELVGSEQC